MTRVPAFIVRCRQWRGREVVAQACLSEATSPAGLALLLQTRLINTVYSYGNAAPETVPAALAIVEVCAGDCSAP